MPGRELPATLKYAYFSFNDGCSDYFKRTWKSLIIDRGQTFKRRHKRIFTFDWDGMKEWN